MPILESWCGISRYVSLIWQLWCFSRIGNCDGVPACDSLLKNNPICPRQSCLNRWQLSVEIHMIFCKKKNNLLIFQRYWFREISFWKKKKLPWIVRINPLNGLKCSRPFIFFNVANEWVHIPRKGKVWFHAFLCKFRPFAVWNEWPPTCVNSYRFKW